MCSHNGIDSIFLQSLNPLNLHHLQNSLPATATASTTTSHRELVSKQQTLIERDIIRLITAGSAGAESLKPNSGQAVEIGGHYVCVSAREEAGLECRVWEWHGHVVSFDEENGYSQDYVYGNYFQRLV